MPELLFLIYLWHVEIELHTIKLSLCMRVCVHTCAHVWACELSSIKSEMHFLQGMYRVSTHYVPDCLLRRRGSHSTISSV